MDRDELLLEEYIKKIDMNNTWAKAKYFHSLNKGMIP